MKGKGFTLIELLVVIAIIGILATIITAALGSARAKGRDASRIADIKVIQTALQLYYTDNNSFPENIYNPSCAPPANWQTCGLAPTYIAQVRTDPSASITSDTCRTSPKTPGCYIYVPIPYGQGSKTCSYGGSNPTAPTDYHLGAVLEVTSATPVGVAASNRSDNCREYTGYRTDFNGKSANCANTSDAGGGYNCYDLKP
jgi:prepilin-type N-terminal cleavage/methylation domain-containing protein